MIVVEGSNAKEITMKWTIMVKVGNEWVKAAVVTDAAEAVKLADSIKATGKKVRVTVW